MIAPSILSADFACLGEQVLGTERAGANRIHIDVMDGHFVPNLSIGPAIVKSLRKITKLPLEVHLMVEEPARFVDGFVQAGADTLIVHQEVLPDPAPLLRRIYELGKKVGLAVNPNTSVDSLEPYLSQVDLALCMTVYPGFSGQKYIPESPARIARLREMINRLNPQCDLEVDGGIDATTLPLSRDAGANVFVAATAIFGDPEGPGPATSKLLKLA